MECKDRKIDLEICTQKIIEDLRKWELGNFYKVKIHDFQFISNVNSIFLDTYIATDSNDYQSGYDYFLRIWTPNLTNCDAFRAPKISPPNYDIFKNKILKYSQLTLDNETKKPEETDNSKRNLQISPDLLKLESLGPNIERATVDKKNMPEFGIRKIRYRALSGLNDFVFVFYNRKYGDNWKTEIFTLNASSKLNRKFKRIIGLPKYINEEIKGGDLVGDQLMLLTRTHLLSFDVGFFDEYDEECVSIGNNQY